MFREGYPFPIPSDRGLAGHACSGDSDTHFQALPQSGCCRSCQLSIAAGPDLPFRLFQRNTFPKQVHHRTFCGRRAGKVRTKSLTFPANAAPTAVQSHSTGKVFRWKAMKVNIAKVCKYPEILVDSQDVVCRLIGLFTVFYANN